MTKQEVHDKIWRTEHGDIIRIGDVPFTGDWKAVNAETGELMWDSFEDGYDVDPLTVLCPVVWMEVKDGYIEFTLSNDLYMTEG